MKDFKLGTFLEKKPKSTRPKTRGFGYQVLGFGSGGVKFCSICATGGNTITEVGNYKIHIFTGPGTFTVNSLSSDPAADGLDYMVVAGGAGGSGGAGGGGGYRTSVDSSLVAASATGYPVTVGAGGNPGGSTGNGSNGGDSVALSITSTGGGKGAIFSGATSGTSGGSGGGGGGNPGGYAGGAGNTPPVSPSQGNAGGNSTRNNPLTWNNQGGGGGAGGAGQPSPSSSQGGVGRDSHFPIFGSAPQPFYAIAPGFYAAGGGANNGAQSFSTASQASGFGPTGPDSGIYGGAGGINRASSPSCAAKTDGKANSGGGGGGCSNAGAGPGVSGAGGSGVVMIAYKLSV
tara:strand:- start:1474 stop:2508 length:1035 start_codon:yes stop_codon:yes gene_type:complete